MEEIWKDIIGYEGLYQISNLGRVKSLERLVVCGHPKSKPRRKKEKILNENFDSCGYKHVQLNHKNKFKSFKIHRLIAIHFIPNPFNHPVINHINGIKTDNRLENLEWCTHKHNIQHAIKTGLVKRKTGEKHQNSKLTQKQADEIRSLKGSYSQRNIGKIFGVSQTVVKNIHNNKSYNGF